MHHNQEIGVRLQEERVRIGLNQGDFGKALGVSKRTQAAYEAGATGPDAGYLNQAAAKGVDVLYVVTGTRTPKADNAINPRSAALLNNLENMGEEERRALERLALALQKPDTKTG